MFLQCLGITDDSVVALLRKQCHALQMSMFQRYRLWWVPSNVCYVVVQPYLLPYIMECNYQLPKSEVEVAAGNEGKAFKLCQTFVAFINLGLDAQLV